MIKAAAAGTARPPRTALFDPLDWPCFPKDVGPFGPHEVEKWGKATATACPRSYSQESSTVPVSAQLGCPREAAPMPGWMPKQAP